MFKKKLTEFCVNYLKQNYIVLSIPRARGLEKRYELARAQLEIWAPNSPLDVSLDIAKWGE